MFLYFDKKGILKTKIDHGVKARQGDDLEVTVCLDIDFFEFIHNNINSNYSTDITKWSVSVQAQKAGSNQSLLAAVPTASFSLQIFRKQFDSEMTYNLVDGQTYYMASFELPEEHTTRYGEPLLLSFNMICQISDNQVEIEEIEVIDYQLASALIEVEKTYGRIKTNLTDSEYLALKAMLEEYYSNTGTRLETIENNYVISVNKTSENGQKLTFEYNADGEPGSLDFQELYKVTQGSTTYSQIFTAIINHKLPYFIDDGNVFYVVGYGSGNIIFACSKNDVIITKTISSTDNWTTYSITVENTANKATNLDNPNDTKYPTTLAVYDAIQSAPDKVKILTFGVDALTFSDIVSIIEDGNFPVIKAINTYYILTKYEADKLTFASVSYNETNGVLYAANRTYEIDSSNNTANRSFFNENKGYKKTNLTDPDDVHYPTTKAVSDGLALKQNTLTFDDTPTDGSTNPVTSDGIYEALADKVDVEEGKGLSENDFTDALKDKLDEIEAQANKTVVDSALSSTSENPVQNKVIYDALEGKVDTEAGYSLMSDAEHTKLSGIETGAQVNILEGVQKNGTDLTITNKKVNIVVDTTFNSNSTNLVQSDAIANFVNSSIATNTAYFIGTFNNITALNNYSGTVTNNDYANVINQELDFETTTAMNAYNKALLTNFDYGWVVNGAKYDLYRFDISTQEWSLRATNINKGDVTLISAYNRYTYNSTNWEWNYTINTSGFTAAQWSAINSGINATKVTSYDNHLSNQSNPHNVTKAQVGLGNVDNTSDATKKTNFTGSIANNNTGFVTGGDVYNALAEKQNVIDSSHKLSADLVDDDNTTNKFVTASDKETWNAKQNAISSTNKLSADYVDDTNTTNKFVTSTEKNTWNAKSTVSVSDTGTATDEVQYITIDGIEKKIGGATYVVDLGAITFNNSKLASTTISQEQYNGLNSVDNAIVKFTYNNTTYLCYKDQKQTLRMVFFDHRFTISIENPLNNVSTVYLQDLGDTIHNPMTSQGDLITANQSGYPVRLGKGTNGQVLTSTETGLAWANVSVDYDTDSLADYVEELFLPHYDITMSVTYCTYTGNTSIPAQRTKTITITPDTGYFLPSTITINGVTGTSGSTDVTWSYDNTTGVITLTNATDDLSITVICNEGYEYSLSNDELTITKAPYTLNNDELTIGE